MDAENGIPDEFTRFLHRCLHDASWSIVHAELDDMQQWIVVHATAELHVGKLCMYHVPCTRKSGLVHMQSLSTSMQVIIHNC